MEPKKYEQREMKHKITIRTVPNGYVMDVDGTGFMYYTLNELIEGFFVHVGLGIVKFMDEQTMRDLLTACATFPKEGDAIQAVAGLQAKVYALEDSHRRDTTAIANLKARNAEIAEELAKTKHRLSYYVSEEEKAKKEAELEQEPKPKRNWKLDRIHKDEVVGKKKIIKVKPGPKPLDIKPAPKEKPKRGRPKSKEHQELEDKLRAKGVLK